MKSIETKIRAIAEKMGIEYIYDDWTRANIRIDRTPLPVMVNVLPVSASFRTINRGANLVLQANCLIAFLDKTEFDFDSTENDVIVHKMTDYAAAFVMLCNESGDFEPIGNDNMRLEVCYDKLDCNVTGVVLDIALTETTGYCTMSDPLRIIDRWKSQE